MNVRSERWTPKYGMHGGAEWLSASLCIKREEGETPTLWTRKRGIPIGLISVVTAHEDVQLF